MILIEPSLKRRVQAYIPKRLFVKAWHLFYENSHSSVTREHANKIGVKMIILEYTGKGNRKTLKHIDIWIVDIGTISNKYGYFFLRECLTDGKREAKLIKRDYRKGLYIINDCE